MGRLILAAPPATKTFPPAPVPKQAEVRGADGLPVRPRMWVDSVEVSHPLPVIEIDPADAIMAWHAPIGGEHSEKATRKDRTAEANDQTLRDACWDKQEIEDWVTQNIATVVVAQRFDWCWRFIFQTTEDREAFWRWLDQRTLDREPTIFEDLPEQRKVAMISWCADNFSSENYRINRHNSGSKTMHSFRFRRMKDKLFFTLRWVGAVED